MMPKYEVLGRNMEMTPRLQEYAEKKLRKIERHLNGIEETRVEFSYNKSARSNTDRYTAQITARVKGVLLRAEERSEDLFAAFDAALDKMMRQIERYKGRRYRGRGDGRSAAEVVPLVQEEEPIEESGATILRRKKFTLIPMTEEEAIEQMNLLGHDFFLFYNAETDQINLLYRRRDNTYGLIEPELG
uniref:Ribosome hibernation promoting factor n=1 Tax=uncultured Chloroflexota bacterium TaxID=166587 RepID=H5S9B1_9CHLR|nr:sigma-54 modulation protein [uncultured Chloroflexota bacterium]